MPFFDFITLPSLMVLAAAPAPRCVMPEAPKINVVSSTADVQYDYSQGLREIQKYKSDTVSPYDIGMETRTQGLMTGSLRVEPSVQIKYQLMPPGKACAWYHEVNIKLKLAPTIILGREVYHDSCMRHAVTEHEMKHVTVDRELVNKYANQMAAKINAVLSQTGFIMGPMPASQAKSAADKMQKIVFDVVKDEYSKMQSEQMQVQQAVDSLAEYERVRKLCPDFRKRYEVRKAFDRR